MFYEYGYVPGLSDFDRTGRLSYRSFFEALENAGERHSAAAHDEIIDKSRGGLSWIITEWRLKINRRPERPEPLTVTTWTGGRIPSASVFRAFRMRDALNDTVAEGEARLSVVDNVSGRLVRIDGALMEAYCPEQERIFASEEKKPRPLSEYGDVRPCALRRSDVDFNGHVHNTAYIDLLFELLPDGTELSEIRVAYLKPVRYGDSVTVGHSEENGTHFLCVFSGGVPCTVAEVR